MLLVFLMKCCIKMPCSLPHNHYCCLLPSPICLSHLFIRTCLNSSPLLAHHHLCYVDVYCFFLSVLKFHSFVLFLSLTAFLVTMLCNTLSFCTFWMVFIQKKSFTLTKARLGKIKPHIQPKMALKGRSRKCSQPSSCNETWIWKQYYQ